MAPEDRCVCQAGWRWWDMKDTSCHQVLMSHGIVPSSVPIVLCAGHHLRAQVEQTIDFPGPRPSCPLRTHPRCSGTSAAPRTPAALQRGGEPGVRGGLEGHAHSSERRPHPAALSRARPTTSCAFINYLLDLGLFSCALSGLFGWWGRCIGSCLGFNPHVCVNFFVGVLLLWIGKACDEVMVTG